MNIFTPEVLSAIRSILIAVGAFAVGKGWLDSTALDSIVGGIIAAIGAWGFYGKTSGSSEALQIAKNVAEVRPAADLVKGSTVTPQAPPAGQMLKDLVPSRSKHKRKKT